MSNTTRLVLRCLVFPAVITALVLSSPATSSPVHWAIRIGLITLTWSWAGWVFWFNLDPERVARSRAKADLKRSLR
ncbi:hypothetical protein [Streptacidiphilus anmyonensis]|uniref:hypothetical protein n=1 Tax=Streptacidiphilus anmyonensis TaxID=405782 RepID=UPI00128CA260|nr:hypothetical protein [Streptacidiphilus anmyonensis]